ncbi:MAG: hypothetical protein ACFFEV_02650 [Candidatus Thorarchaeota archaeon]
MKEMTMDNISENSTLDQMLRLLRRDAVKILAELDLSESLQDVEEILEDERWLATPEEYKVLDFIRSLALISTKLQLESFENTKRGLTEFWQDIECESNWEDCKQGVISD